MLELNKVFCGDCLKLMEEIDDKSINLAILDLPYNIKKDSWDRIENYEEWVGKILLEIQRVLVDNGSMYFFHNKMEVISELMQWVKYNTDFVFKNLITWEKYQTNKQYYGRNVLMGVNNQNHRMYYPMAEYILFYTFQDKTGLTAVKLDLNNFTSLRSYFKNLLEFIGKNKKQIIEEVGQSADHCFRWSSSQWDLPTEETYNKLIEMFEIDKWEDFKPYWTSEGLRNEYEELRNEYEELRYTFNFVDTDITTTWLYTPAKKSGHLTPKPVDLLKNIILHSSNEGDLILDPTCGSGSTCVAARELGRNFIGIEKEEKYCQIAEERLQNCGKL